MKIDKRSHSERAVVVNVLTQPGATKKGLVINLNDPSQTATGIGSCRPDEACAEPERRGRNRRAAETVRVIYATHAGRAPHNPRRVPSRFRWVFRYDHTWSQWPASGGQSGESGPHLPKGGQRGRTNKSSVSGSLSGNHPASLKLST